MNEPLKTNELKLKDLGIDTYRENIIFLNFDSQVCQSEGLVALTRVFVEFGGMSITATLNVFHSKILRHDEAGLSMEAMKRLGAKEGDTINISHLKPIASLGKVRAKMFRKELSETDFHEIISDVVAGHYSNIELAAFISACSGDNLSLPEIIGLTKAMVETGQKIHWLRKMILDKHCVGGLPGNRTTPIVVSIVAAAGLVIPKTSSKAITSPAGTSDAMETMTTVDLDLEAIKAVVEKENGCMVWGGAVNLSPADDILISVEKALDVDSEGQMIASVLSKKAAAGATHVLIDIPVGPTAKVRSREEALRLQYYFKAVGDALGLHTEVIITDGLQPVGRGIGPALEAIDILSVLRNEPDAPDDLRSRSLKLAVALLELSGKYDAITGSQEARRILESGEALRKFMAICKAQGGFREPGLAPYHEDVVSDRDGVVKSVDNRKLARLAKMAGAPLAPSAGVRFYSPLGKNIRKGDLLFCVYAEAQGELEYAMEYLKTTSSILQIE
ncbi:MAG TPA: thymidine phosphorylase family protein [Bacteroidia bacterium]|jgi:thymidine phosphorylase|nr:thymidine phosphorylase family protein [Bacteroidia bacterium]